MTFRRVTASQFGGSDQARFGGYVVDRRRVRFARNRRAVGIEVSDFRSSPGGRRFAATLFLLISATFSAQGRGWNIGPL